MPAPIDIKVLCQRLDDQAEQLARHLLPRGRREGVHWIEARRADGGMGDSLKVTIAGQERGSWHHYAADAFGDMLDLVGYVNRLGRREAIGWARRWLGLEDGQALVRATPAQEAAQRQADAAAAAAKAEQLVKRRKAAKAHWLNGTALSAEDPAGQYLLARGIDLRRLLQLGYGLHALRFHAGMRHPVHPLPLPALIALCTFPSGEVASLHRTYLVQRKGSWDRLRPDVDRLEGKALYCELDGGICPLWRGERVDPKTGEVKTGWPWSDERAGPELVAGEGIENMLALAQAAPEARIAATISLPNFARVRPPKWCRELVWFGDNDPGNPHVERLLPRAIERLQRAGIVVRDARPPPEYKDANDVLTGKHAASVA